MITPAILKMLDKYKTQNNKNIYVYDFSKINDDALIIELLSNISTYKQYNILFKELRESNDKSLYDIFKSVVKFYLKPINESLLSIGIILAYFSKLKLIIVDNDIHYYILLQDGSDNNVFYMLNVLHTVIDGNKIVDTPKVAFSSNTNLSALLVHPDVILQLLNDNSVYIGSYFLPVNKNKLNLIKDSIETIIEARHNNSPISGQILAKLLRFNDLSELLEMLFELEIPTSANASFDSAHDLYDVASVVSISALVDIKIALTTTFSIDVDKLELRCLTANQLFKRYPLPQDVLDLYGAFVYLLTNIYKFEQLPPVKLDATTYITLSDMYTNLLNNYKRYVTIKLQALLVELLVNKRLAYDLIYKFIIATNDHSDLTSLHADLSAVHPLVASLSHNEFELLIKHGVSNLYIVRLIHAITKYGFSVANSQKVSDAILTLFGDELDIYDLTIDIIKKYNYPPTSEIIKQLIMIFIEYSVSKAIDIMHEYKSNRTQKILMSQLNNSKIKDFIGTVVSSVKIEDHAPIIKRNVSIYMTTNANSAARTITFHAKEYTVVFQLHKSSIMAHIFKNFYNTFVDTMDYVSFIHTGENNE